MKIIKLLLLFTFTLWSNSILLDKIPSSRLKAIIQNGWNDSNQTLNHIIIGYAEKNHENIMTYISHPLTIVKPTEKDPLPNPILNYTRKHALLIVSYIKYLEYSGDKEKAKILYSKLLRGLSEMDVSTSYLGIIFRIVIENIVTGGLSQALESNIYDESEKIFLKNMLYRYLLLDTKIFFYILNNQKDLYRKYFKEVIIKVPDNHDKYQELREKYEKAFYLSLDKYINLYYGKQVQSFEKIIELKSINPSKKLAVYLDIESKKNYALLSDKLGLKEVNASNIDNMDMAMLMLNVYVYSPEWLAKMLVLLSMPHLGALELDFVLQIDKNVQLLKMLD